MNDPRTAALQFLLAILLGAVLGLIHGFLGPVRRKNPHLADLLFLPALTIGWLQHSFRICLGDLRPVWLLGIMLGIWCWESSVGILLRPFFSGMWHIFYRIWEFSLVPVKKIYSPSQHPKIITFSYL